MGCAQESSGMQPAGPKPCQGLCQQFGHVDSWVPVTESAPCAYLSTVQKEEDPFALQHPEPWGLIPVCTSVLALKHYTKPQTSARAQDFKIHPRQGWVSGSQELFLASLLVLLYQWPQQLSWESSSLRWCKLDRGVGKGTSNRHGVSHVILFSQKSLSCDCREERDPPLGDSIMLATSRL